MHGINAGYHYEGCALYRTKEVQGGPASAEKEIGHESNEKHMRHCDQPDDAGRELSAVHGGFRQL